MALISDHAFGQIFLIDPRPEWSKKILGELGAEVKFFEVELGVVKK